MATLSKFQSFVVRLAAKVAPPLGRVLRSAGGTVEALEGSNLLLRSMLATDREAIKRDKADMQEAVALAQGGWMARESDASFAVRESDSTAVKQLKETISGLGELELALDDRGWSRQLAMAETEFSRYGIQRLILISRLYRIKNPLIQRGVLISSYYVFGRGVEISSTDKTHNEVLEKFFNNPSNICEVGQNALTKKEEAIHTDGNLFWAFFTNQASGDTEIRSIDPLEIERIIADPEDRQKHRYYHRRWTKRDFNEQSGVENYTQEEAYYLALGYEPKVVPDKIAGKPVARDAMGQPVVVYMCKDGNLSKWDFGCPLVYAAIDWARAYRHLMEDWCTIQRALARFSWQVETQGGAPAIASFKQALATTLANDGTQIEQNPPPVTGSSFITGPGNKLTPVKTSGATTSPEEGRRVLLMVAAAFGLPETFFGDASTGSLATAVSLDRPTELKFMHAQERWREWLQTISYEVLKRSKLSIGGKLYEAEPKETESEITVEVKFPSILEHDVSARVAAIREAMTLNGYPTIGIDERTGVGLMLEELGVEDVEGVLEAMYPSATYDKTQDRVPVLTAQADQKINPPAPVAPGGEQKPGKPSASKESIDRAVLELRTAYQRLKTAGVNGK